MKLKLFTADNIQHLEDDINDWLDSQPDDTEIYHTGVNFSEAQYVGTVAYYAPKYKDNN